MLNQRQIGKIIFDVEQGFYFAIESKKLRSRDATGVQTIRDTFHERELDPKAAPAGRRALADGSTHRFNKTLGKGKSEASALASHCLGPKPIKRRKEPTALIRGNARTFVADRNAKSLIRLRGKIDNHPASIAIIFHG